VIAPGETHGTGPAITSSLMEMNFHTRTSAMPYGSWSSSWWPEEYFILGAGSGFRVQLGAVFEFLLIIANIATAVVLYPIVKRHSQIGALGYVAARIMESAFLMVGLLSLVSLVALRQDLGGATGARRRCVGSDR
jgi:Domain of unknown function (DUF4386)